ncbi:alpha/beta fold hydrolase [Microbacterium hydrocarbonoxydans]|uniref:Pimeloyl-ACP methyl ester carboxylesterase n=1 Tax=Microbacterium hydrocarbonoxydans TaxID=273678 RepID=A0A1H4L9U2_9MICO|nr:alpha/beta hydrolase [Microbacterium hydrocarbonoxydans]SEB67511.1 Pimeloyl-ACP methyl ester carboxylesterase [Microbacterium hydrocarbonoxydans]
MSVQIVLVHGIRTSATMWRSQLAFLEEQGIAATAVDLPGHGSRMFEDFTLHEALHTIDVAVRDAATRGPVLLVGHSMGGLLSLAYVGGADTPQVAGLVAASCTSLPRGAGLSAYRAIARAVDRLPDRGMWITKRILAATIPEETRFDFAAGGYALDTQDTALRSLSTLDLATAVARIRVPLWFVNGQWDQLRVNEALFQRLAPHSELIIVPRTTHLVTAMRPQIFNAVLRLAVAMIESGSDAAVTDAAVMDAAAELERVASREQ